MEREYCTQNNGDCETCSLSNYGRDCMNNPIATKCGGNGGRDTATGWPEGRGTENPISDAESAYMSMG